MVEPEESQRYQEAIRRIEAADLSSSAELDLSFVRLSSDQLSELLPKIGTLTSLTRLNLWDNGLTALPPEIGALTSLTSLDLRDNGLTALPPEIGALTSLTDLNLWDNGLTALPPEIGALTSLTDLNLWDNGLTALPPEIGALTSLTDLGLMGNGLTALPPEIGALTSLAGLNLIGNGLTALPPEIGALTSLTDLNLRDNDLTALPPEIGALTSLTSLDLRGNGLTALPPEIGALTSLTSLDLRGNGLTALPPEIGALTSLAGLNLGATGLTALPPEIWALTSLTSLNLVHNGLTALPPEIGALTSLTGLDLWDNDLTALPPEIGALTSLTDLNLGGNGLTALPPEIGALTSLTSLDLGDNGLTALPPEIGALTSLTDLNLWGNDLTALPPGIGALTSLRHLDLSDCNKLAGVPRELGGLADEIRIRVSGTPLAEPPGRVVMEGPATIRRYFDLKAQEGRWVRVSDVVTLFLERPSRWALCEALLFPAGALCLAALAWPHVLWTACCVAPLVLFRTDRSVDHGVSAFRAVMRRLDVKSGPRVLVVPKFALLGLAAMVIRFLLTGWHLLRRPWEAVRVVPSNYKRQLLVIDARTPVELVPGLEQASAQWPDETFTVAALRRDFTQSEFIRWIIGDEEDRLLFLLAVLGSGVFWLAAWGYRFTVKASAVVWWPFLCFGVLETQESLISRLRERKPSDLLSGTLPLGGYLALGAAAVYALRISSAGTDFAGTLAALLPGAVADALPGLAKFLTAYPPRDFDLRWVFVIVLMIAAFGILDKLQRALLAHKVREAEKAPSPDQVPVHLFLIKLWQFLGNAAVVAWTVLALSWALPYTPDIWHGLQDWIP